MNRLLREGGHFRCTFFTHHLNKMDSGALFVNECTAQTYCSIRVSMGRGTGTWEIEPYKRPVFGNNVMMLHVLFLPLSILTKVNYCGIVCVVSGTELFQILFQDYFAG